LVGTARCAVSAAFSGAADCAERPENSSPSSGRRCASARRVGSHLIAYAQNPHKLPVMRPSMFCLVVAVLLCGCAHPTQTFQPVPTVDNTPLAPGDCIMVVSGVGGSAAGEPPRYVLDSSGDISMPQASRLHLAGLTLQQAAEQIKHAYAPGDQNQNRFYMVSVKRCP